MGSRTAAISKPRRFSTALSSAVLEWLLILFLYFDAFSSYLVTKFSRICKLQTPCLLCSRLDHILGNEKPGYYWNLVCDAHKSEISSLAFCQAHHKLANVLDMCEGCLLSFASEKSNPETYRSLAGKLGIAFANEKHNCISSSVDDNAPHEFDEDDGTNVPLLENNISSSSSRKCSCCSELFRHKRHAVTSVQDKLIEVGISKVDNVKVTGHSHPHRLDKAKDGSFSSSAGQHIRNQGLNNSSHNEENEKITSDSESEVGVTDDHVGDSPIYASDIAKKDFDSQCQSEPMNILNKDLSFNLPNDAPEDLIRLSPVEHEASGLISEKKRDVDAECEIPNFQNAEREIPELSTSVASGYGLEKTNWNHIDIEDRTTQSGIIADDTRDILSLKEECEISNGACTHSLPTLDITKDWRSTEMNLKTSHDASDPEPSMSPHMDLNDAYKLAVGARESLTSPSFKEVLMGKDSFKVQEDLKLLISQLSASRGLESHWNEMSPSPRIYDQGDEPILHNITKSISIERKESGLESLEGSIVSEIEGESVVERLKRQIDLDRKSISLLYKELEEERNSSAISANQAMAMITRLQEEKAAMQMEALHYQRMMEEQAEYDHEAIQKCNELLAEREKEIQDLEADLESYRKLFTNKSSTNKELENFSNCHDKETSSGNNADEINVISEEFSGIGIVSLKDSFLCLEDEKAYISDCLTKLEKKLLLFSNNGFYADNSSFDANDEQKDNICVNSHIEDCMRIKADIDNNAKINGCHNDDSALARCSGSLHQEEDCERSSDIDSFIKGEKSLNHGNKNESVALDNEILDLRQRLEALEADRSFLEHAMNSLRNRVDGAQFIQEISHDLRELRRVGIMRRKHQ